MDELHRQVVDIQNKVHDLLDKPQDPAAGELKNELQHLEDDVQLHKNAYDLDERIERIIHILQGKAKDAQIMNYQHLDMFVKWFEHLRETVHHME